MELKPYEYTVDMSNEDYRIATYVYNKKFSHLSHMRDDLIQIAAIALWQRRPKYDPTKAKYISYAMMICYHKILMYLRSPKNTDLDTSLDIEFDNGTTPIDIIGKADNDKIELEYFNQIIAKAKQSFRYPKINELIELHLQGETQAAIAAQLGTSRALISRYIKQFKARCSEMYTKPN